MRELDTTHVAQFGAGALTNARYFLPPLEYNHPDMHPQEATATSPEPTGMGEFSRIAGVFFEPKKAFADIAAMPAFLVPLILVIAASLGMMIAFTQHVGWERTVAQQMANSPRTAQMTPEQRQQAIATGAKFASMTMYVLPILIPVTWLIIAGVLTGITAGILSAGVKFKQVFAIVAYANLVGVIMAALSVIVMFLKNPDDFNIQNPLMFNVGAYMDPQTSSKFLYSLATSLDLFSFWMMLLMATGLRAAAGKKLSFGGALFAVVLPWAVYVLGKSAIAGVFAG